MRRIRTPQSYLSAQSVLTGRQLQIWRLQACSGMTQYKVAKELGISMMTVSRELIHIHRAIEAAVNKCCGEIEAPHLYVQEEEPTRFRITISHGPPEGALDVTTWCAALGKRPKGF